MPAPARPVRRALLAGVWAASQLLGLAAVALAPDRGDPVGLVAPAVLLGLAAVGGELAGARADLTRVVDAQRTDIEGERERRARLEERTRLARELHDVVAHHLSVVVARADSAPARLPGLAEPVRGELAAIADEARESLTEMRRVLRLLRDGDPAAGGQPRHPQPGLADLAALVEGTRATGATVTVTGPVPAGAGIPATAQLTAYRVVQEALTNAIRHAPGAPVTVSVEHHGGRLEVTVTNPAPRTAAPAGGGEGLRGIVERVAAAGGTADRRVGRTAASPSVPASRWDRRDPRPRGRRPAHRPGRVARAARRGAGHRGGRGGRRRRRRCSGWPARPGRTWCSWTCGCPAWTGSPRPARCSARTSSRRRRCSCSPPSTSTSTSTRRSRAGASGFLLKDAPPAELIRAVRVVAAGDALLAPEVTRRLVADFVRSRPAPRPSVADLTPRETEVLVLIAEGLSNAEIAARLFLAEQTVKTHVGRILTKLGLRDRAQAVVYAYRAGLVRA